MPEFTDATLDHFEALGRLKLSTEMRLRVVRYSPTVSSNTITLPDDCNNIIQVTWRGHPLNANLARNYMDQGNPWYNSVSVPTTYIFNKLTQFKTIRLFPTPNETLASVNVDTGIASGCVITYQADVNAANPAPAWMERRILKYFIGMSCFGIEGKFQNLQVAKYMGIRWDYMFKHFQGEIEKFYLEPRSLIIKSRGSSGLSLNRRNLPVLPARYGRSTDDSSLINH